jgi:acetyl-CoA C-acetyltransferase
MSEVVIAAIGRTPIGRTPIGRAVKGSLIDQRPDDLRAFGGAIALGHPFGMTGVRILAKLLNDLRTRDQIIGLKTMCVGGGQGMAMVVERLS